MANRKTRARRHLEETGSNSNLPSSGHTRGVSLGGEASADIATAPTGKLMYGSNVGEGLGSATGTTLPTDVARALGQSSIHGRLQQSIIRTTEDHLKVVLMENKERLQAQQQWITPLSLFLTFITTLIVSDFKTVLGVSGDTWQAFFLFASVFTAVWTLWAGQKAVRSLGRSSIEHIINELKKTPEEP